MLPFAIPAAVKAVPWKWLGLGLLVLALAVQSFRLERSERRADALEYRNKELTNALDAADRKSREQQKATGRIIERVVRPDDSAARRIENAPLPPDCKTPVEILQEPKL